jgi:hypothetical protein
MSRGKIIGSQNRVEWVSEGQVEYLLTPSAGLAHEALDLLEENWPDHDTPVSPADLYLKVLQRAERLYVPGQRGSKGSENQDRYFRFAVPKPSDSPGEVWEDGPFVPVPQLIDGQPVVSAVGNHVEGWLVLLRLNGRWRLRNVHWVDGDYQASPAVSARAYSNFQSGHLALVGAGFLDRSDDDLDPASTIKHLDKLLTAELYRQRTSRHNSDFDERMVKHLVERRRRAEVALRDVPAKE